MARTRRLRAARPEPVEFPPAARQPRDKLERGECISNALEMAEMRPSLRYAEGVAKGALGLWYAHAWNVNPAGEAVDYTWRTGLGTRYIGVIIPAAEKLAYILDREVYAFTRPLPYVPDGEIGLDCTSKSQEEMFANLAAHRRHEETEPAADCALCLAEARRG